jgi:hypothetical protein
MMSLCSSLLFFFCAIAVLLADQSGVRTRFRALPQRGISVIEEDNALRHNCQGFSAALRQKIS